MVKHSLNTEDPVGKSKLRQMFRPCLSIRIMLGLVFCCSGMDALAFRVNNRVNGVPSNIGRWNAAPHFVDGVERSLDGGLRYSLEGGSYQAYRDLIQWHEKPSVEEFQAAVEDAFNSWTAVDPETNLGTDLYFVPDFDTAAFLEPFDPFDLFKLNRGAEIDLFVGEIAPGTHGFAYGHATPNRSTLTLTSGVENYPAGAVFSGWDIVITDTLQFFDADDFQQLLSHEIGHALGLADVDVSPSANPFISDFYDDNFDNTDHDTALATLTNSFAHLIDPYDPDNSPGLMLYEPCNDSACNSAPGFDSPGVNINQESSPQDFRIGLQADDFAGRHFLYPYVQALAGDFNIDFDVDGADFLLWQRGAASDPLSSDDLALWQANYGAESSLASPQAVPEPQSLCLFALGICFASRLGNSSRSLQVHSISPLLSASTWYGLSGNTNDR